MKIIKAAQSKREGVDFNQLPFGTTFTDHMFVCDFVDGAWQTPEIVPYGPLSMDPSSSVLHYGQAVFEGMKAYKDEQGQVWLFRPDENFKRINKSSVRLHIPEFPEAYFFDGLNALLKLDAEWIQKGVGNSLYVRPFVFASTAGVQASPGGRYKFIIICAPVKSYYSGEVRVKIEDRYSRAAPGGVGYAKAAGNYGAQFYPTSLAQKEGFQQIIWTDASSHQYLEEAGTMNVFFRIKDTLITAPVNDSILDGVTRKSIIEVAKSKGMSVEIRPVEVAEIIKAHQAGTLKEIFGCGTAVVVSPISGFGYQGKNYPLETIENAYATTLKETLLGIQYNTQDDPYGWRYAVR